MCRKTQRERDRTWRRETLLRLSLKRWFLHRRTCFRFGRHSRVCVCVRVCELPGSYYQLVPGEVKREGRVIVHSRQREGEHPRAQSYTAETPQVTFRQLVVRQHVVYLSVFFCLDRCKPQRKIH